MSQIKVIIGEDDLLVAEEAAKWIGDGVGLELFDSASSSNEELQLRDIAAVEESYLTAPFFDPKKITWWKNANVLPGGGKKKAKDDDGEEGRTSQAVKDAVARFFQKLARWQAPENQLLVITARQLLPTSVIAKSLKEYADVKYLAVLKGEAARQDAEERARARAVALGLEFSGDAARRFIECVGFDERSIKSEIEKLASYKGGQGKITPDDIDAISTPGVGVETPIWGLTDAISRRDAEKALTVLTKFQGENGFAVMMTSVIEKQFRTLVELKAAQEQGRFEALAQALGVGWKARQISFDLAKWNLNELRTARMRFMNLRERFVSSGSAADAALPIELLRALKGVR